MLTALFGDVKNGRLRRLPYVGYSLLMILLVFGFMFASILAIGVGEQVLGGDLQQAQDKMRSALGTPFIAIMGVFMLLVLFAELNLMAKRIRDIGLPGWWSVLVLVILSGIAGAAISDQADQAGQGFHLLLFILLALIPTGVFGGTGGTAGSAD